MTRRRLLKTAGGLAVAAPLAGLALANCGGESGGGGSQANPSPTTSGSEREARRGGKLRVALTGEPPNLDIHQSADTIVILVTYHMYETLFTWDSEFNPVPLLAEGFDISEDGLTTTVTLRQGVPFHNGEELQAKDVIASIERWGRIVGLGEGLMAATDRIVEVDPYTVEFQMNRPFGTFAVALARALQGCAIYPKSVLDRSDDTSLAEFIGTGPYRFVTYEPDRFIRLERFDDYANPEGEPDGYAGGRAQHLDEIEFVPTPNEASRIAGLQAGDFHYLETVSTDYYESLNEDPRAAVELVEPDAWLNYVLNLSSPVTAKHDIRRAIQLALDPESIMKAAFGEGFYELTPTLLPGAEAWRSDAGAEHYNHHDPGEARRLIDEAGYDGAPLRFMTTQEEQFLYNSAVVATQQLEAVGFTVDLQVYDGATLSDRRQDPELWEIYTAGASFRPDPVMRNMTCSATGWWCDEEKDALLADLQSESDYETRFEIWEEIQRRFYEDVPRLKIGDNRRILVRSPQLHGISETTQLQPDFSSAWLDE